MHLEVLTEDRSGAAVMQILLEKLLSSRPMTHTYAIRPHRGKGSVPQNPFYKPGRFNSGLLDLLPAKARAYKCAFYPEELLLVVIMDSDSDLPQTVHDQIDEILVRFAKPLPAVIGICVEEMEAWLLGDEKAVLSAFPTANRAILRDYEQDSVCGTWETLTRVIYGAKADRVIKLGYPVIGQYKFDWSRRIAPYLDPEHNRSPSFRRFLNSLERELGQEEERARLKMERTFQDHA